MKPQRIKTKKRYISLLVNSAVYFMEHVFILRENRRYRLLVIHKKRKLKDKKFKTLRGARISFANSFIIKIEKPDWSHFYQAEPAWLKKMLNMPFRMKEKIDARNRKRVRRTQAVGKENIKR